MSRIAIPEIDAVPAELRPILDNVHKAFGFVPNLHRVMPISSSTLSGWASLMSSLSKTLDARTRDGIALAVSEADGCNYCLAAHSYMAANFAKMSPEEIELNREGRSGDARRETAIGFTKLLIETHGKLSQAQFNLVRKAGWSNENIVEMVGLTAQFLMTNFINNAVQTDIDFPGVAPAKVMPAGEGR